MPGLPKRSGLLSWRLASQFRSDVEAVLAPPTPTASVYHVRPVSTAASFDDTEKWLAPPFVTRPSQHIGFVLRGPFSRDKLLPSAPPPHLIPSLNVGRRPYKRQPRKAKLHSRYLQSTYFRATPIEALNLRLGCAHKSFIF